MNFLTESQPWTLILWRLTFFGGGAVCFCLVTIPGSAQCPHLALCLGITSRCGLWSLGGTRDHTRDCLQGRHLPPLWFFLPFYEVLNLASVFLSLEFSVLQKAMMYFKCHHSNENTANRVNMLWCCFWYRRVMLVKFLMRLSFSAVLTYLCDRLRL